MSALPPGVPAVVLEEIDNIVGRFASLVLDHQGGVCRGVMRPGTSMARKRCSQSGREVSKFVETGSSSVRSSVRNVAAWMRELPPGNRTVVGGCAGIVDRGM